MIYTFRQETCAEKRHEMSILRRLRVPLLAVCLALVPSAKADIFVYDVQSSFNSLHVRFELSSFVQDVVDQTVFDIATSAQGTITRFDISGGSAGCDNGSSAYGFGPCWLAVTGTANWGENGTPSFTGAGTFSFRDTTVTITDVPSSVPEPSALVLLSSGLLAVGLVVPKRRLRQRPEA
jgi:hypothetical protein